MISGSVQFGATNIEYDVLYSERRKQMSIAVFPSKRVVVTVPMELSTDEIHKVMNKKAAWVIKKLDWFDQLDHPILEKEYVNGETFLYLGRQYRLKIRCGVDAPSAKLKGKFFEVLMPDKMTEEEKRSMTESILRQWYKVHAEKKICEMIFEYAKRLHVEVPRFKVKYQDKRWGSCSSDNMLNINARIIMAPRSQIEYVVAHELCHLKHRNHSSEYWQLLHLIMPDYEICKENLKNNGWKYNL